MNIWKIKLVIRWLWLLWPLITPHFVSFLYKSLFSSFSSYRPFKICACIYSYTHKYIYTHTDTQVCVYIKIYIYTHMHTHICIFINDGYALGFLFPFIFISWRLITLQYCSGFCHTLTWISHGFTCITHPDPPFHLPLHPIPLGLPSAPGLSTCLMHPAWAGDLFHYR